MVKLLMKRSNLFKNNPKKVKKAMLALKAFIGTISVAALFQSPYLAAIFLIAGAAIDFVVDINYNDDEAK
jgi:hypothetical protein